MKHIALALALALPGCGSAFELVVDHETITLDGGTILVDAETVSRGDGATPSPMTPATIPDVATVPVSTPDASSLLPMQDASTDASTVIASDAGACVDTSATWFCSWNGASVGVTGNALCLYEDVASEKSVHTGTLPASCACHPTCACVTAAFKCPDVPNTRNYGIESNSCVSDTAGRVTLSCQYVKL